MQQLVFGLAILAAACGGKPAPDCATAITNGVDRLTEQRQAQDPAAPTGIAEPRGKLKSVLIQRCTEDKWPSEVVGCFAGVRDHTGIQACVAQLSEDRRRALMTELRAALMDQGARELVAGARELLEQIGLAAALVQQAAAARSESDGIAETARAAKARFDTAVAAAQDASDAIAKLAQSSEELDKRLGAAVDAVMAARSDAERAAASATLRQLKREAAEVKARIAAAVAEANAQRAAAQAAATGSDTP